MKSSSQFDKILLSIFITVAFGFILFFRFYIISSEPGDYSTLSYLWIFIGYALYYIAILILLLRLIRIIKSNNHLLYVLLGVANIFMWALCIAFFYLGKANMWWLNRCILNLLLGVLIIADGFVFRGGKKSGV
jgi:hypothetical protein